MLAPTQQGSRRQHLLCREPSCASTRQAWVRGRCSSRLAAPRWCVAEVCGVGSGRWSTYSHVLELGTGAQSRAARPSPVRSASSDIRRGSGRHRRCMHASVGRAVPSTSWYVFPAGVWSGAPCRPRPLARRPSVLVRTFSGPVGFRTPGSADPVHRPSRHGLQAWRQVAPLGAGSFGRAAMLGYTLRPTGARPRVGTHPLCCIHVRPTAIAPVEAVSLRRGSEALHAVHALPREAPARLGHRVWEPRGALAAPGGVELRDLPPTACCGGLRPRACADEAFALQARSGLGGAREAERAVAELFGASNVGELRTQPHTDT